MEWRHGTIEKNTAFMLNMSLVGCITQHRDRHRDCTLKRRFCHSQGIEATNILVLQI